MLSCKIIEDGVCKHICDGKIMLEAELDEAVHWQQTLGPHGGHILINPETGQKHYGAQTFQAHRDVAQLNKLTPRMQLPSSGKRELSVPFLEKPSQRTKRDLSNSVAEVVGLPQSKVKQTIQHALNGIAETILSDGRAELRGFGVFQIKQREARIRQNPKTGERVEVPAKMRIVFSPGKEIRHKLAMIMQQQNQQG